LKKQKKNRIFLTIGQQTSADVVLTIDPATASSLNVFSRSKREWRKNVKDDFYNRTISPIFSDRIEYIGWLFDGGKGSGKSTKGCSIYEKILKDVSSEIIFEENYVHSPEVNLIPVRSLKQVFPLLNAKLYQVIIVDDASRFNKALIEEVKQDFNEIRHIYGELTGEGVIILLFMCQDLFQLAKFLRKDLSGFCYNDAPQDESDQNYIDRQTCGKGMNYLTNWTSKVKDDKNISFLSKCVVSTESWAGYMTIPRSKDKKFRPWQKHANPVGIKFLEPSEQSATIDFTDGEYLFEEIERVCILKGLIGALENYDSIVQERKITTNKLNSDHVKAFILYLKGMTYDNIGEEQDPKVTASAIGNDYNNSGWIAIVREELIGHVMEWVLVQNQAYYENYSIIAGKGRVDLLSPDKQKAIEVKSRKRKGNPKKEHLSKEMKRILSEGVISCELAFCEVKSKLANCVIYSIVKSQQKKQDVSAEKTTLQRLPRQNPQRSLAVKKDVAVVKYGKSKNQCPECKKFVGVKDATCQRCGNKL
jgi:hypothetical protein